MERKLKIYFTSDIHGYLYPETYADRSQSPLGLLAAMRQYRKDGNTLILDGGDMLQGSALAMYCQKFSGDPSALAEAMNQAGYDFVTLGNHDFNYGYEYLTAYLKRLQAKVLCANVRLLPGEDQDLIRPYEIVTLENGLRVAVTGIVTDYVNIWEQPEHLRLIQVTDPFAALQQVLVEIGNQADLKVCIYHGGYEADLETGELLSASRENVGYRICRELPLDILLTGHQHMPCSGKWISGTYTAQTPDKLRQYLYLEAVQKDEAQRNEEQKEEPGQGPEGFRQPGRPGLTVRSVLKEPAEQAGQVLIQEELGRALAPLEQQVQDWLDQPLGRLSRPLKPDTKIRMAVNGSPIADFINQIQLEASGAQIACCGLANEVAGFAPQVTTRAVIASYPYPNTLLVLKIDGKTLRKALERTAEYFQPDPEAEEGIRVSDSFVKPKVEHYNYDYFMGIHYVIDAQRPLGERVCVLEYQGQPVQETDTFSLCINNYRASGAGGYEMYQGLPVLQEINREMTELIIEYLEAHPVVEVPEARAYEVRW